MLTVLATALLIVTGSVNVSSTRLQETSPQAETTPANEVNTTASGRPAGHLQRAPARAITARAPSLGDGPTKVLCRRERTMDSNIPVRVCREVAVNSAQRERMGTDMTREMQQMPYNVEF